jgi:hypothetical protein
VSGAGRFKTTTAPDAESSDPDERDEPAFCYRGVRTGVRTPGASVERPAPARRQGDGNFHSRGAAITLRGTGGAGRVRSSRGYCGRCGQQQARLGRLLPNRCGWRSSASCCSFFDGRVAPASMDSFQRKGSCCDAAGQACVPPRARSRQGAP